MTIKTNCTNNTNGPRPPQITIGKRRRDGKYKVRIAYCNGPNMFGGYNYPSIYNKLYTAEQINNTVKDYWIVTDNSEGTYNV